MPSERTRVGHCKADSTDHYVGRGEGGKHIHTADILERGWLGSPYTLEDYSREESIKQFRDDFEHRLEHDATFRIEVTKLAGDVLGCWCQHLDDDEPACHAEVIAEHADRLAAEEQERFDEAFENYVGAYPPEHADGDCHNCGKEFDADEWDERHISAPDSLGETWKYTCPGCDRETVQVGT